MLCCLADLQGVARILEALQAHQWPGLCRKAPPALGWALRAADAQQSHALLSDERGDSHPESRAPHGAPADADAVGDNGFLQGSDVLAFREFLSSDGAAAGASPLDETDEGEQRFDQLMEAFAGYLLLDARLTVHATPFTVTSWAGCGAWFCEMARVLAQEADSDCSSCQTPSDARRQGAWRCR